MIASVARRYARALLEVGAESSSVDAFGQDIFNGVRVAQDKRGHIPFDVDAVTGADDIQFADESGRDTLHGIGGKRAGEAVGGRERIVIADQFERVALLLDADSGWNWHGQFALGAFDFEIAAERELHTCGQRDRLFTYS